MKFSHLFWTNNLNKQEKRKQQHNQKETHDPKPTNDEAAGPETGTETEFGDCW